MKKKSTRRAETVRLTPTKIGRERAWQSEAPRSKLFAQILARKETTLGALIRWAEKELKLSAPTIRAAVGKMALDKCIKVSALLPLMLTALLAGGRAEAQEQEWTYTGEAFNEVTLINGQPTDYETAISGSVVLGDALNPNEANQVVTPVAWQFSSGLLNTALFSNNPTIAANQMAEDGYEEAFSFSTTNGGVTAWSVTLLGTSGPGSQAVQIDAVSLNSAAGDQFLSSTSSEGCFAPGAPVGCSTEIASTAVAGSWVDPPVSVPELDRQKAIAAFVLLCGLVLITKAQGRS